MAKVFLSYSGEDRAVAEDVLNWLYAERHEVFFDRDPEHGIAAGDDWEQRLYERLRWADAVLCVVTRAYIASSWCSAELGIARSLGCRLLPLRLEPGASSLLLRAVQVVEYDGNWRRRMGAALRSIDAAGGTGWMEGRSPFPGLKPFEGDMQRVFFGREKETGELAALLRSPSTDGLTMVIGPSGCGKSSLLRAGLVPHLAADPAWWVLPVIVPGEEPVRSLARALAAAGNRLGLRWTATSVFDRLGTERGFADAADDLLAAAPDGPRQHLLVVIDQVEELINRPSADFVRVVTSAPTDQVRLVGSIRPEFLKQLLAEPALAGLIPQSSVMLRPLTQDTLRSVIEGPARLAGIRVEDELTERLVADTGDGEALPLLAYTLSELAADAVRGTQLSALRYDKLGGVRGAVRKKASEALAAAKTATGRGTDEVVAGLLRLVAVDEEARPTRWRVARAELPDKVNTELDQFVANRLLVVDTEAGAPVISVSHEAFLSEWQPLADAIEANAKALRERHTVERAATEWDANQTDDTLLLRGARLDLARRLLGERGLSERGTRFVEASLTADGVARRSARRRRRVRIVAALTAVAVVAVSATALAITTAQKNAQAMRDATRQLLAGSQAMQDTRPETALRWGITASWFANQTGDNQLRADAHDRLVATLASARYLGKVPVDTKVTKFFAGPQSLALTATDDYHVELRHIPDGTTPLPDTTGTVDHAVFLPEKHQLVTLASGGPLTVWNVEDWRHPTVIGTTPAGTDRVTAAVASTDGTRLFTGDTKGVVSVWNLADAAHPARIGSVQSTTRVADEPVPLPGIGIRQKRPAVASLALRPDGTFVSTTLDTLTKWTVTGTSLAPLAVTDLPPLSQALPGATDFNNASLRPVDDAKLTVALAPGGDTLLIGGSTKNNAVAMLVNVDDPGRILATLPGHTHAVYSSAFSSDGRYLATTGADYAVRLWDVLDPQRPLPVSVLSNDVGVPLGVEFSPEGDVLYAARGNGWIDRYATEGVVSEGRRATLADGKRLVRATIDADGRTSWTSVAGGPESPRVVAVADQSRRLLMVGTRASSIGPFSERDAIVRLLDISGETPKELSRISELDTVTALAHNNSGHLLAVGTDGGSVFVYRIDDPKKPEKLAGVLTIHGLKHSIDPMGLPTPEIAQLAFSPDSKRLAVGTVGAGVLLYDVSDTTKMILLTRLTEPTGAVHALAFSPDSTVLAAGSGDGVIRVWDTRTTTPATPSPTTTSPVSARPAVALPSTASPSNTSPTTTTSAPATTATSESPTTTERPPDQPTINPLTLTAALQSPDGGVLALAYQPGDTRLLATGSTSGAVTLWDNTDPAHPKRLQTFRGPAGGATTLEFDPNGDYLVATDGLRAIVSWSIAGAKNIVAKPVAVACHLVHEGLTPSEWKEHLARFDYLPMC